MSRTPCQYVIRNGKLQPRVQNPERNTQNYRIITYEHTVRKFPDDYFTATIKQYKREIQQLKKNYSQLQVAYWHLLETSGEYATPDANSLKKASDHLQSTKISISQFNPTANIESSINILSLGGIFAELQQTKQKLKKLTESSVTCLTEEPLNHAISSETSIIDGQGFDDEQQSQFQYKLLCALEQIHTLKQQLQDATCANPETKQLLQQKNDLEKTVRKLQQILERQKKNNRMLNQMICRMRNDLNSKQNLIKDIVSLKKLQRNGVQNLIKKHSIKVAYQ